MKTVCCIFLFFSGCINAQVDTLHNAGDNKENYDENYQTNSLSLNYRKQHQKKTDLLIHLKQPPLGLPKIPIPKNNPITLDKVSLGKKLFFDRRLSFNNTISCGMCHIPEHGFSNNELSTAVGIEGRSMNRNSPTIYNVAYIPKLFFDGREDSLELQVWGPMLSHNEMGNPSFSSIINKIKQLKDYKNLFEQAFAGNQASVTTIGQAIASYERLLVSANSNFDKWYYTQDTKALSKQAKTGFALFTGKAGCVTCHHINKDYALLTDNEFHNTGLGYQVSILPDEDTIKVQLSPGVFVEVSNDIVKEVTGKVKNDLGLYAISQQPKDLWKYKTPTLRNIALTAPYMHNGSFRTLKQVVEFYNQGGIKNDLLSPFIHKLNLSDIEIKALVIFLQNLTGSNVNTLLEDAFATPIGEVSLDD